MDHSEVKHLPKVDHTPAELDAASLLLLKAAAIIEEYGLHKGQLCISDTGQLSAACFRGALNLANTGYAFGWEGAWDAGHPRWEAERRFAVAYGLKPHSLDPKEPFNVPAWNNAPERTGEEVVAKMRAVALSPRPE